MNAIFEIDIQKINPNPYQPRVHFDDNRLASLADSIRRYGVLQPIVVSKKENYQEGGGLSSEYEIIAGERRWRAAKLAGLEQIPAIIRENDHTDAEKLELAIIENVQREDLNPIDRAKAFRRLADEFGLKHTDIASKLGKSREFVSNALRLLSLPEKIQEAIIFKKISDGHAKSLLTLKDKPDEQLILFNKIISNKLTVRSAERLAREVLRDKIPQPTVVDPEIRAAEKKLAEKLGTKVHIEQKAEDGPGKITIEYFSKEDLEAILQQVHRQREAQQNTATQQAVASSSVSDSVYDAYLKSKNKMAWEERSSQEPEPEKPDDPSLGQLIDEVNHPAFDLSEKDEPLPEAFIPSVENEEHGEDVKIDSVVTGTEFLTAKTEFEEPEEEIEKPQPETEDLEEPEEPYSFQGFSI